MFTISAKGIYGLNALIDLAGSQGTGPRQIKDIAEAHAIPQHYLEQILVSLKKAGLVESFRGASGGYALARPASAIQIIEVLAALEGKLEVISEQRKNDMLAFFWRSLENHISRFLDTTLEDLLHQEQQQRQTLSYDI